MANLNIDKDHDSSSSDSRKYNTPSTVDLYRAPRYDAVNDYYTACQVSEDFGFSLLSKISAVLDFKHLDGVVGDGQAMTIFDVVRCTVIEMITLN